MKKVKLEVAESHNKSVNPHNDISFWFARDNNNMRITKSRILKNFKINTQSNGENAKISLLQQVRK